MHAIYTSRRRYTKLYVAYNFQVEILDSCDHVLAFIIHVIGFIILFPRQLYLSHIEKLLNTVGAYENSEYSKKSRKK